MTLLHTHVATCTVHTFTNTTILFYDVPIVGCFRMPRGSRVAQLMADDGSFCDSEVSVSADVAPPTSNENLNASGGVRSRTRSSAPQTYRSVFLSLRYCKNAVQ